MTYTPEQLEDMAGRHDRYSVCTQPSRDHFAEVCREYAEALRRGAVADTAAVIIADELERLNAIGNTRRDLLSAAEWEWWSTHPLVQVEPRLPWSDVIPPLVAWLCGRPS